MTTAALAIIEKKKRICKSTMRNYKNLQTVVAELMKFLVRRAKLIAQFVNTFKNQQL